MCETTRIADITHVIFDLDGLLIDTERVYTVTTNNITRKYGKEFTWDLKTKCMGLPPIQSNTLVVTELNLPLSVDQFTQMMNEEFAEAVKDVDLMPGVMQLITHLHRHNIPMALATGSNTEQFATKTAKFDNLFKDNKYFSHRVLSDDLKVKKGKPFPDIFIEAMNRFNPVPKPDNCLVFEDAVNGITAAIAANMPCVWVPDARTDTSRLKASLVIQSLEDFKPEIFGLPPF
ncbi:pseudouridine-5'-phosphatase-like [Oppia nitens]|uniref:pseudouridine-5'-phosphatase-like n=1 Tax=Oppia nitens TaxID=1686743 RepID=UPI0023DA3758|nr:pseudouridine-5'-phosphatase-like [Oppia nitens]